MPIDLTERSDSIKRNRRRRLNLDDVTAVLGRMDTNAVPNPRMPGRVWISVVGSNGLLGFRSAIAPTKYFKMDPGVPVKLKYDNKNRLQIDEPDADAQLTTGIDPVAMSIQQTSNSTSQSDFETLRITASDDPDLNVIVKAWNPIDGVYYQYPGEITDLSSFVPSSGEMCYALIAMLSTYDAVEVVTSTPRPITDPDLGEDDVREAMAALSDNSVAIWAVALNGDMTVITQSDIDLFPSQDLRQALNIPEWVSAPVTASDPGFKGQKAYDATHFYVCINTDTWVRCTLATW